MRTVLCFQRHHAPEAHAIIAAVKTIDLATPDVTLRLDLDGVIREVSCSNSVSSEEGAELVGRPWVETVEGVGSGAIRRMVADARTNGVSDFRQVTQRFPSGRELPIEYTTVRLGAGAGLLAIGRSLAAVASQQTMLLAAQQAGEQDAWKLRSVETRYRLLFESSDDPILLLRTGDLHIIDANPPAVRAGALDAGREFAAGVAPADREAFRAMMARVGEQGRVPGMLLHLGASSTPWLVRASLASAEPDNVVLLHLVPAAAIQPGRETVTLDDLMERLPDGFALIDGGGIIRRVNRAFLDLVQMVAPASTIGQPLGRWLSRPGADAAVLIANVQRHRLVRSFATSLQGELGSEAEVEISAAGDRDQRPQHIGLLVRDVSRRLAGDAAHLPANGGRMAGERLIGPLAELAEQIGRTPLTQLVRDTGGMIERHCIENALERVNGNRTAAAGLLGLSRQSLYAKLSRYGLGGNAETAAPD